VSRSPCRAVVIVRSRAVHQSSKFDRRPLPVGSVRAAQAGTQSPQEMPHRVGVEQLLLPGDRHTRSSYTRGVSWVAKLVHVARHERW
jgi:hypothetical protein